MLENYYIPCLSFCIQRAELSRRDVRLCCQEVLLFVSHGKWTCTALFLGCDLGTGRAALGALSVVGGLNSTLIFIVVSYHLTRFEIQNSRCPGHWVTDTVNICQSPQVSILRVSLARVYKACKASLHMHSTPVPHHFMSGPQNKQPSIPSVEIHQDRGPC